MIKCPKCGSEDFEIFDTDFDMNNEITQLCICEKCDVQFCIVYTFDRIEVDD